MDDSNSWKREWQSCWQKLSMSTAATGYLKVGLPFALISVVSCSKWMCSIHVVCEASWMGR